MQNPDNSRVSRRAENLALLIYYLAAAPASRALFPRRRSTSRSRPARRSSTDAAAKQRIPGPVPIYVAMWPSRPLASWSFNSAFALARYDAQQREAPHQSSAKVYCASRQHPL